MPRFLETVLPTSMSAYLLAGSIPIASILFAFPGYLPTELWEIQSLNLLQARILLAGLAVLLCMTGSLISILIHHKKTASELSEIKKFMSIEQMIAFKKTFDDLQRTIR